MRLFMNVPVAGNVAAPRTCPSDELELEPELLELDELEPPVPLLFDGALVGAGVAVGSGVTVGVADGAAVGVKKILPMLQLFAHSGQSVGIVGRIIVGTTLVGVGSLLQSHSHSLSHSTM